MSQVKKYYAFQPAKAGDATFGLERLADIQEEIRPLHAEHYQETETTYLEDPFNPDYERYKASEEAGQFILFTVRLGSTLVGYLQYYMFRDMHTQEVSQAREDALFISLKYRGKKLAPGMLAYAEDALKQLGCKYIGMTSKAPVGAPDIGPFLEKRGYKHIAEFYQKKLEG